MGRIVDLSVFGRQTLEVKLPDGKTVLHLRKPSQEMVIAVIDYQHISPDAPAAEIMHRLDTMALLILRTNDVDMVITDAYVADELNTGMKVALAQAYAAWIGEVQSDPN